MKVVRIGRPPYDHAVLTELRGRGRLAHPEPTSEGYAALVAAGVAVEPLGEEVEDGVTLILPIATGETERLVQITDRLLGPGGCPWDQKQTHESLKRYLIEEAYEVCEAIDNKDLDGMREELGDLILQPVLHAAMQRRDGGFTIDDVAKAISDKLVRRHPHVFGDLDVADADEVLKNWDQIKKLEKGDVPRSILEGVPKGMPSLLRAFEVSKRAARNGFEWPSVDAVWDKLREEEEELRAAIKEENPAAIASEVGDLLFTMVNVARWLDVEPEEALATMVNRFSDRFRLMEQKANVPLTELSFERWDELWNEAKNEIAERVAG